MSWTGPSETLTKEQVKEIMSPYWDSNELIDNRPARDLWKKPSSGIYMIAYAMKNRRDRCVHIMGYNFWFKAGSGYKAEHPFQEERRLVQQMLRMERNVFFHPMMPVETWHGKGELLYGV